MEIEMYENPMYYNPRRKRRKSSKRNPIAIPHTAKGWFRGLGMLDVAGAGVGLALATAMPGWLRSGSASSATDKLLVMGLSIGGSLLAGMVMNTISPTAGKYAVLGGLAGTAVKGVDLIRGMDIAKGGVRKLTSGKSIARYPAPVASAPFEGVRLT